MSKLLTLVAAHQGELNRFFKFAAVGAIGAIIDFSVLNALVFNLDFAKPNANIVSVCCAIISNFTWNRLWTFPESRERALHTQFGKFAVVNVVGLLINQSVFVLTDALIFEPAFGFQVGLNLAKATAIGIVLFWNFGVNRLWTYRGL